MTAPMGCKLLGRWRIVESDLWDRDHLDLCGPASIVVNADGYGKICLGALQAGLTLEYAKDSVWFEWDGFDEMDEVCGSGSAHLQNNGGLEIEFAYRYGDEALLKAERC
ncbi:hypothetical protein [Hyphococcus luteus]|uniref:Alkaline proteinase inhibitor/ Outer membrane lipoprotein Omp19 domain-containing protein n=1 Tax=Hyphococcus luteus TaxID=2058213 RepID=A0A2S7K5D0_9PROT|nr:hypothetical protein [Marinicaulis flavus]PQA87702.1 hypothetical protein CW354_04885 [Marinicaulis flavus]